MKPSERATIASWIETEGCILTTRIKKGSLRQRGRIQIGQREKAPLEWLQARVGGSLRQRESGLWHLVLSSQQAYKALRLALPYFISPNKKKQAELVLKLDQRGLTEEYMLGIKKKVQLLKKERLT